MKIFVMLAAAFLGFINLFIPILPEHKDDADWIVDGEYFGYFYDEGCEEKVMNQFMGLVEEENIDGMFNIFSKNVRADCPTTLKKSLPELADFLNNRVASWEYRSSYSNRGGGAGPADRVMLFDLHTEEGLYRFTIRDYIAFSHSTGKSTANSGFRSITIIPEELHSSYMGFCYEKDGVHIVYRADGGNEAAVKGQERMENWMELAEAGDVDGFYEQFAPVVKNGEGMDGLPEKIRELEGFLSNEITSWEPHSWTQYNECYPTSSSIRAGRKAFSTCIRILRITSAASIGWRATACTRTTLACAVFRCSFGWMTMRLAMSPIPPIRRSMTPAPLAGMKTGFSSCWNIRRKTENKCIKEQHGVEQHSIC